MTFCQDLLLVAAQLSPSPELRRIWNYSNFTESEYIDEERYGNANGNKVEDGPGLSESSVPRGSVRNSE
jgi:hypothetical protein